MRHIRFPIAAILAALLVALVARAATEIAREECGVSAALPAATVATTMIVYPAALPLTGGDPTMLVRMRVDIPPDARNTALAIVPPYTPDGAWRVNGAVSVPYTPTTTERNSLPSPTPGTNQTDVFFRLGAMPVLGTTPGVKAVTLLVPIGGHGHWMLATGTVTLS